MNAKLYTDNKRHLNLTFVTNVLRDKLLAWNYFEIMKCHFISILLVTLLTSTLQHHALATVVPELRSILYKHWDAIGGMANWNRVESILINSKVEREGQVVDLCVVKKRPDQIRATVTVPLPGSEDNSLQIIRAHDGKQGWTATRLAGAPDMHQEILSEDAAAELSADASVLPRLIQLWREGVALELTEPTSIQGESMITIRTPIDEVGSRETFFLSAESFLLAAHEKEYPTSGTTRMSYSNYEKHGDILLPRQSIIESSLTGRSVVTTESVEIGVGIYEEYFSKDTAHQKSPE